MSDRKLSRGEVVRLPIKSMDDLREAISADAALDARTREARRSAIKKFCKWMDRAPEDVPADAKSIRNEFRRLSPVLCGVSKGRFSNVKSLINRALLAHRRDLIDTRKAPLLPEWEGLFAATNDPDLK